MKRILSIGRLGGKRMDDALIERLARRCLEPIDDVHATFPDNLGVELIPPSLLTQALDNIKDAIREAFLRGMAAGKKRGEERAEVSNAGDHAGEERGV